MEAAFLGGSRRIALLNESVRSKLDELIARGLWMFIGDANGADRAIQQHFAGRGYEQVLVYSMTEIPRNNVGHWKIRLVEAPRAARGFDFYSAKDEQMAEDASFGLMLWDGKSRGTLENVRNLLGRGKPATLYLGPARRFVSLRSMQDLAELDIELGSEPGRQQGLPLHAAGELKR
jgi:adenine-specific DNA-methyltransferase